MRQLLVNVFRLLAALATCIALTSCGGGGGGGGASALPQISSLNATSVSPMSSLTVQGSGFDPGAAVAVRFAPESGAAAVTIPASAVSATSVSVPTPLLFDPKTGLSSAQNVDVTVIESSPNGITTSSTFKGLQVEALPPPPSGAGSGTLTAQLLSAAVMQDGATEAAIASNTSRAGVLAALRAQDGVLNALISGIKSFNSGTTGSSVTVTLGSGQQVVLDASTLSIADQIAQAFLAQAAQIVNGPQPAIAAARRVAAGAPVPVSCATNLCYVSNFFANLSGANPAITAQMEQLFFESAAEVAGGEITELAEGPKSAVALAMIWSGETSMGASAIANGESPPASELFYGSAGGGLNSLIEQVAGANIGGATLIFAKAASILYMAATTMPPGDPTIADLIQNGMLVQVANGDTADILAGGTQIVSLPKTSGTFDITSMVVPLDTGLGIPGSGSGSGTGSGSGSGSGTGTGPGTGTGTGTGTGSGSSGSSGGSSGSGGTTSFSGTFADAGSGTLTAGAGCTGGNVVDGFGGTLTATANGNLQVAGTYTVSVSASSFTDQTTISSSSCTVAGSTITVPGSSNSTTYPAFTGNLTVVSDGSHLTVSGPLLGSLPSGCSGSANATGSILGLSNPMMTLTQSITCSMSGAVTTDTLTVKLVGS